MPLNISEFNLFFMWQLQPLPPLKKVTPLFYSNSPLKGEVLPIPPPFLKIWLEAQVHPAADNDFVTLKQLVGFCQRIVGV